MKTLKSKTFEKGKTKKKKKENQGRKPSQVYLTGGGGFVEG